MLRVMPQPGQGRVETSRIGQTITPSPPGGWIADSAMMASEMTRRRTRILAVPFRPFGISEVVAAKIRSDFKRGPVFELDGIG